MLRWGVAGALLLLVLTQGTSGPVSAGTDRQPFFVSPTWGTLSSPLGWRIDPIGQTVWQHHWGIDIAAPKGTPVLASSSGTVRYADAYAGYGPTVYLEHAGGWATVYAHLSQILVLPGQPVAQGMVIGAVGNFGRSTGPHLHFEMRFRGMPVDPLRYLGR